MASVVFMFFTITPPGVSARRLLPFSCQFLASLALASEDLREAIVLCEWEERNIDEAATILETTPKAVESRLYRARQILREHLNSWL
jgi:DNA-directed RNA polymerase specialized sigma24 family protein